MKTPGLRVISQIFFLTTASTLIVIGALFQSGHPRVGEELAKVSFYLLIIGLFFYLLTLIQDAKP